MKIVILGCGRVGSTLAMWMSEAGHEVAIIDRESGAFERFLGPEFRGETLLGLGIDQEVLRQAGIEEADAFVAVSSGDNTNVMAAQIAKVRFRVPRVIARVYDPIRAQAYREMGVETLCTTLIGAGVIQDLVLGEAPGKVSDYLERISGASGSASGPPPGRADKRGDE